MKLKSLTKSKIKANPIPRRLGNCCRSESDNCAADDVVGHNNTIYKCNDRCWKPINFIVPRNRWMQYTTVTDFIWVWLANQKEIRSLYRGNCIYLGFRIVRVVGSHNKSCRFLTSHGNNQRTTTTATTATSASYWGIGWRSNCIIDSWLWPL